MKTFDFSILQHYNINVKEREIKNMTTKEIKELALQILNRNGETGIKKSDFTVKQAKQLIKEYNLGWMKQKGKKNMTEIVWQEIKKNGEIVTKQRTFKTEKAAEKFIEKLYDKDNFYNILATR